MDRRRGFFAGGALLLALTLPSQAIAAFITTQEASLDAIFSQGTLDIDIRFNATLFLNDATFLDIDSEAELLGAIFLAPEASPIASSKTSA